MANKSVPFNPYEPPNAPLEAQTSVRRHWTGRVVSDLIGGIFWIGFGSFWAVSGLVDELLYGGVYGRGGTIAGFGTLAFGLFLTSRVEKARRRDRTPSD